MRFGPTWPSPSGPLGRQLARPAAYRVLSADPAWRPAEVFPDAADRSADPEPHLHRPLGPADAHLVAAHQGVSQASHLEALGLGHQDGRVPFAVRSEPLVHPFSVPSALLVIQLARPWGMVTMAGSGAARPRCAAPGR